MTRKKTDAPNAPELFSSDAPPGNGPKPGKRKPKKPTTKTSPRLVKSHQDAQRALELRARGLTYDEIAEQIGHKNRSSIHRLVQVELERVPVEEVGTLRKIEVVKLDRLERTLDRFIERDSAVEEYDPDRALDAVGRLVKVMERRAKLLGLDAPTQSEIKGTIARTLSDAEAESMSMDELAEIVAARAKNG